MREAPNTNILVIDDEEMVRDNIEEILVPQKNTNSNIHDAASILFDTPRPETIARNYNIPNFNVDKAANGMEGVAMIKKALAEGKRYAVIFLDMRMPGWDGLETAMEIRKLESQAEIIFVTAFSDRTIDEIVAKAGQNVGYHCKPYAAEEIIQLATKAVTDYSKLRNLENLIEAISSVSLSERQLTPLLQNILDQLVTYTQTDMALIGKLNEDFSYEKIFSIGSLEDKIDLPELISFIRSAPMDTEEVLQLQEVVMARMDNYTIFAALKKNEKLKTEKLYLLKLFVHNAAKAIKNAELNEKLLQKEKLSAIGSALGMMMHDLRSPVNNISILTSLLREEGVNSEYLDMIDTCGTQAAAIFDDFLDFIKETKINKKPFSLDGVIAETVQMAKVRDEKGAINIIQAGPGNLEIAGDESKIKRCLANLLTNAIDVLTDYRIEQPEIRIDTTLDPTGSYATIKIRDNGPGIPADILKSLFQPFVTKYKNNGTGLGLAIVKQYIRAHGGEINVENDNGAVFTIQLPVA